MKNIKFYIIALILLVPMGAFFSCSSDKDNGFAGGKLGNVDEKFDATIAIVSNLNETPSITSAANAKAIADYFKTNKKDLAFGIIDRADVKYAKDNMVNYGMDVAAEGPYFPVFAPNKMTHAMYEGSMLLFPFYMDEYSLEQVSKTCNIRSLEAKFQGKNTELESPEISFNMNFSTAKFSSAEDLSAFLANSFPTMATKKMNTLMIGTVKSSLAEQFQEGVTNVTANFRVSILEGTEKNDYSIFLLSHQQFWAFKQEKTQVQSVGGTNIYSIHLMW